MQILIQMNNIGEREREVNIRILGLTSAQQIHEAEKYNVASCVLAYCARLI